MKQNLVAALAGILFAAGLAPFLVAWWYGNWLRSGSPFSIGLANSVPFSEHHTPMVRFGSTCVDTPHFFGTYLRTYLDKKEFAARRTFLLGSLLWIVAGPNGSGKSTTIKLLLGLIFASRGSATVLGHPAGNTAINERIGFLPEESYLYRFLNGEETLRFYGRLFKIPRAELNRRVPALLDTVGLDAKARKRKLREYSKGMARRIGLAQALINNPDLILLDEPTTGLDPIGTREMKDLILSLKQQGKTVLLCSHLLADVQDVCDRITILFRGTMQTIGQVRDLLQVKDVTQIQTPSMNDQQIA